MELEELKLKWKVLSERLDREQVIRRQDMERMLRGRVGSYLHYVQLMLLLGVAVVPLCVAIGKSAEYPVFSSGGSWRATFYVCSLRSFPCGCCCGCRAAMPISSSVNTA